METEIIIFDFGLTLVYPQPDFLATCLSVAHSQGIHIAEKTLVTGLTCAAEVSEKTLHADPTIWASDVAINDYFCGYFSQAFWVAFAEGHQPYSQDIAATLGKAVYARYRSGQHWRIYDDVITVLDTLRQQDYTLGIFSDWHGGLRTMVCELQLDRYFQFILSSSQLGAAKAQSGTYVKLATLLDLDPHTVMYVGDSIELDYQPALEAGMRSLWLNRRRKPVADGVLTVETLDDLLGLL